MTTIDPAVIAGIIGIACEGSPGHCADAIDALATGHAGTPPQRVKDRVISGIRHRLANDHAHLERVGSALVQTESPGAREVGVMLLAGLYPSYSVQVIAAIVRTGADANWEVREWAASALATIIPAHLDVLENELNRWIRSDEPTLRRMVAVAAGYAFRDTGAQDARRLLQHLTPLLYDRDPYVTKNLGPFALGSYAIRWIVEDVVAWALALAPFDEQVAINVARIFTTAEAAKRLDSLMPLATLLIADDRPAVQRAMRPGRANLAKRSPELAAALVRQGSQAGRSSRKALE